jgi:hypothetical protein
MLPRLRHSWLAALAVCAALLAVLSTSPSAHAASTICTGTIEQQTITGNIIVPANATCILLNVEVSGSVFVQQSGSLILGAICGPEGPGDCKGTTVSGNVIASHARLVSLEFSRVAGNVVVQHTDSVGFYRSAVAGSLILIGNREVFFQGAAIPGNVVCRNNLLVTGNFPTEECAAG